MFIWVNQGSESLYNLPRPDSTLWWNTRFTPRWYASTILHFLKNHQLLYLFSLMWVMYKSFKKYIKMSLKNKSLISPTLDLITDNILRHFFLGHMSSFLKKKKKTTVLTYEWLLEGCTYLMPETSWFWG